MHIEKAKSSQVIGYILHDTRACENHTNEKIDPAKANLNYNLVPGQVLENYNKRMEQVFMRKNKNTNALAMFTTTLPKDFPSERSEEFFRACHRFYCDKFGEENIISDMVHRDETTDHMHTKLIPVYFNEKKQRDTVSFDKVINRNVYKTIHKDLQKYLEKELKCKVNILNGATAGGNKTIAELKTEEINRMNKYLQKENKELLKENKQLEDEISNLKHDKEVLLTTNAALRKAADDLEKHIEIVEEKVEETKEIIKEIDNFENSKAANWIADFIEKVRRTISKARNEGKEPKYLSIPVKSLETLEKALQPFVRLKQKIEELIHETNKLQDLISSARKLRDSSSEAKDPTKRNHKEKER